MSHYDTLSSTYDNLSHNKQINTYKHYKQNMFINR
jgi:hypothetical protein